MRNISQAVAAVRMASIPTAAVVNYGIGRRLQCFNKLEHRGCGVGLFSPRIEYNKYNVEERIRRSGDGVSFPFSFCTLSSTQQPTIGSDDEIKDAAKMLDIRVGRIIKAWRHEEADSLYVEEVDIGEAEPRLICSGLVNYIPLHLLLDQRVIVLANLKPRNMRGIKSFGMLMAASDLLHENVELLLPPEGSIPGERIWFGSEDEKENQPVAATPNQIQKKKIWEMVQPHLKTDASCTAILGGEHAMRTSAGVVTCKSLKNANIS